MLKRVGLLSRVSLLSGAYVLLWHTAKSGHYTSGHLLFSKSTWQIMAPGQNVCIDIDVLILSHSLSPPSFSDTLPSDPLQCRYDSWLSLVDHLNIKAFVNLTLADSVRHGVQHLLFISGLGGMRPNTLVLGFYDDCTPKDKLTDPALADATVPTQDAEDERPPYHFPALRASIDGKEEGNGENGKVMGPQEYVAVIADAMKMMKNVALARYFHQFDRASTISSPGKGALYVDVWPVNLLRPDSSSYVDTCSLFLLQLACVLNMVRAWRHARLRLFLCVEEGRSLRGSEGKLGQLLKELRIKANVYTVPWDQQVALHWQRQGEAGKRRPSHQSRREEEGLGKKGLFEEEEGDDDYVNSFPSNATRLSDEYLSAVNRLILEQAHPPPAVRFLYLPAPRLTRAATRPTCASWNCSPRIWVLPCSYTGLHLSSPLTSNPKLSPANP
nr:solute carrier family 12 member 9-like [Oncorhynchus nerka]